MKFASALALLLCPALAFAAPFEPVDKYVASDCSATPAFAKDSKYPGREAVIPSSKLALPAGKAVYAAGERIYVMGRVLDENCVPVPDAIVDIWQTDTAGNNVQSTLGDRLKPEPHFTGSGRAVTDNLGRYSFVSVFPGPVADEAPFIHVRVAHKSFAPLQTRMYFEGDRRNSGDADIAALASSDVRKLMSNVWQRDPRDPDLGLAVHWDIILTGKNKTYKKF